MNVGKEKNPWYIAGLYFQCQRCGRCCSGPGTGFIWVTHPEIELIADFMKISAERLRQKYLKRLGLRTTIIEHYSTKDCVFLRETNGQRICGIYPVRPSQCRIWPFWSSNLTTPTDWDKAAQKCPGINHGKFYSFEEIQKIKSEKKWW